MIGGLGESGDVTKAFCYNALGNPKAVTSASFLVQPQARVGTPYGLVSVPYECLFSPRALHAPNPW